MSSGFSQDFSQDTLSENAQSNSLLCSPPQNCFLAAQIENICYGSKMFVREICSGNLPNSVLRYPSLTFPRVEISPTQARDLRFSHGESKEALDTNSSLCSFRVPTSISTMKNGVKGKRKASRLSIDTWKTKNSLRGT